MHIVNLNVCDCFTLIFNRSEINKFTTCFGCSTVHSLHSTLELWLWCCFVWRFGWSAFLFLINSLYFLLIFMIIYLKSRNIIFWLTKQNLLNDSHLNLKQWIFFDRRVERTVWDFIIWLVIQIEFVVYSYLLWILDLFFVEIMNEFYIIQ